MKAVLISIKPKRCELIASGKKTVEARKTKPKLETPFKCYIYCTQATPYNPVLPMRYEKEGGNIYTGGKRYAEFLTGKVIGEFVCDRIDEIEYSPEMHGKYISNIKNLHEVSCVDFERMFDYIADGYGYAWHISDLVIYDKPKELSEFKKAGFLTEEEWLAYLYPNTHCHYEAWAKKYDITRPPQSWCYVDELTEKGGADK